MHPTIQLALRAARSVTEHYDYLFERLDLAQQDRQVPELLASCSQRIEQSIERQLVRAHPDASMRGRHVSLQGSGEMCWAVDALVGEANLAAGYPAFALSISVYVKDRLEHVVLLNPASNQEFMASRGRGAILNGRRIRVASGWKLEEARLALPVPSLRQRPLMMPRYLKALQQLPVKSVFASGCAGLDICAIAAGQLDAGLFFGVEETELAPFLLVLKEAGGLAGDLSGAPQLSADGVLLVTNAKAFRSLVSQFKAV